jgi:hypothetical protein
MSRDGRTGSLCLSPTTGFINVVAPTMALSFADDQFDLMVVMSQRFVCELARPIDVWMKQ